jgi:hypothetical protein
MTGSSSRSHGTTAYSGVLAALATGVLALTALIVLDLQSAQALPSFARQTGQQCVACHNGFPELTPYGRQFKLNGYTFSNNDAPSIPLAALFVDSFTHTQKDVSAPVAPGSSRNDNLNLDAAIFFYAGKITDHIGAYATGAYIPLIHKFSFDHTDVRYANTAQLFGKDATFGVSLNNSPGQTDPWNTAQNYSNYPYGTSFFQPSPVASTALQGRYGNQIMGGNSYVSWNRWLYAAAGVYGAIDTSTLNSLGINTRGLSPIDGAAPYWRLAIEPAWGHSTWEFGTFGMAFSADPHEIKTAGTDKTVDVGIDTEYQYLADRNSLSFMASYINERSTFSASKELGFSTNSKDILHAFNIKGTYTYDQTYAANLGYFRTTGSRDEALYGGFGAANGSPNSDGWVGEFDYYPFNRGGPSIWRELGLKFGLQYTYYSRFDGAAANYDGLGRSANANNSLLLYSWTAF